LAGGEKQKGNKSEAAGAIDGDETKKESPKEPGLEAVGLLVVEQE